MKKRYEEWWKLTGERPPVKMDSTRGVIRMLGLPGFQRMEDTLLLEPPQRGVMSPRVESLAEILSKETFGIIENDTRFELPEDYDDLPANKRAAVDDEWTKHEDQFLSTEATDDEATDLLLELGIDFRDARGQPMRCVKLFARQAEAAAMGIAGKLPDIQAARLETWAEKMTREAEKHIRKKRGG